MTGGTAMDNELPDTAEAMEAKETAESVPLGWKALFWGLILWGAYYLYAYSPWTTGWTQAGELEHVDREVGGNVLMTVLFTALATLSAVALLLVQRRRKP